MFVDNMVNDIIHYKYVRHVADNIYKFEYNTLVIMFKFIWKNKDTAPYVKYKKYYLGQSKIEESDTLVELEIFYSMLMYFDKIAYGVVSQRKYGEPKLKKPSELKNIKSFATIPFNSGHSSVQLFRKDNDLYMKHSDYHSKTFIPSDEDMEKPVSFLLKKYFDKNKKEKFIYADSWCEIILRGEAWIKIDNIFSISHFVLNDYKFILSVIKDLFCKYENINDIEWYGFKYSWWRMFWENVSRNIIMN